MQIFWKMCLETKWFWFNLYEKVQRKHYQDLCHNFYGSNSGFTDKLHNLWLVSDWYYQFSDTEMTTDRAIKVSLHIAGLLWSDLKHETIRLTFLFWEAQHITLNHSLLPFSIFRTKLCQICCHIGWKCSHARDFPPTGVKECLQELLLQTQID